MKRIPLTCSPRTLLLGVAVLSSAMLLALPGTALATMGNPVEDAAEDAAEGAAEEAAESPGQGQSAPDFRFSAPGNTFGLRAGWVIHSADSEIFDFVGELLTLESSSFNGPALAVDFGFQLSGRLDAVLGFEYSHRRRTSEYRDWVDANGIPIVQDSSFTQVPLTLSLKFYLVERGRSVGQYAWVPTTVVPYVGGGGGMTWYRFEQVGEFVDFLDLAIFEDLFRSDGWTPSLHAFAGVDIKLNPSLGLILEGRYQWASADMSGSFVGFDPIDLNGLRLMAGVNWKF